MRAVNRTETDYRYDATDSKEPSSVSVAPWLSWLSFLGKGKLCAACNSSRSTSNTMISSQIKVTGDLEVTVSLGGSNLSIATLH